MEQLTWQTLILAILGSSGFIGGLITLATFVSKRLDARKKRHETDSQNAIQNAVEMRRLQLETEAAGHGAVVKSLWEIIEAKNQEINVLKGEMTDAERAEKLDRSTTMKIFQYLRQIRNEMDSLNIMLLNEEETNVFARRWGNIKVIMGKLEAILSGEEG